MIWTDLYDYSKDELIDIMVEYNNYLMEYPETHDAGSYPISLWEFVDNEYQDILEKKGTKVRWNR